MVIGLSPREQWPDTEALAQGFERVLCGPDQPDGQSDDDRNLDACLARRPQLVLIDELSHKTPKTPATKSATRTSRSF